MTPPEGRPATPAAAAQWLQRHGPRCWHAADADALAAACAAVPEDALASWPEVARWRALAAMLRDEAEVLPCLALAHAGHRSAGDAAAARMDACMALVVCVTDTGTMQDVNAWVQRSLDGEPAAEQDTDCGFWVHLGRVARGVVDPAHGQGAGLALAWLHRHLQPLGPALAPHERLLAAQVLVNAHFARQQYEQFDLIAAAVEAPAHFGQAPTLLRARWHFSFGYACYQVGRHAAAQAAWQAAHALAQAHGHAQTALQATLALLRLHLDRGELAEAAAVEAAIDARWGAGRPSQLMHLQQMRARLQLLRGRPVPAQALLREALALGEAAGLGAAEMAGCHTDEVQVLLALGQTDAAAARLGALTRSDDARNAAVFRCLADLLDAWRDRAAGGPAVQATLAGALQQAQALRYTMFFRLLPALAAQLCELALRWDVEAPFAAEVVQSRRLPAPPGAGPRWPWPLWLRLFGGFEIRLHGQALPRPAKPQAKPLELLRLLACQGELSLPMRDAADALWPEADGPAAQKSLEMTVQRLRRLLGDDSLLTVHEGSLALDPRRASTDRAHRRTLAAALQALALQTDADPAQQLQTCAALCSELVATGAGSGRALLPGAPDAPWLLAERAACERELARAVAAARAVQARAGAALGPVAAAQLDPVLDSLG